MLTDTHCHLALIDEPVETVIERAADVGVGRMVTIGVDLASSAQAVADASAHPGISAGVGIHPHNAIEATDGVLERLRVLAEHPSVVAIGETGLDFFRDHSPRVRQEESFREHIRLAKALDKALVIHDRDAHEDVVRILLDERAPARTVFHCFSGDVGLARLCAAHGWYASFAGNVTFPNASGLRESAAALPVDLLLTETDSPYLSPHPHRGRPNEPARVTLVVDQLAALHGMDPAEMAVRTSSNAATALRLGSATLT